MHSDRKIELFDEIFLYVDPRFLGNLSPLLILSVAATVSEDFSVHLRERLHWVNLCLGVIGQSVSRDDVSVSLPQPHVHFLKLE
jgi:hypothetical protein